MPLSLVFTAVAFAGVGAPIFTQVVRSPICAALNFPPVLEGGICMSGSP